MTFVSKAALALALSFGVPALLVAAPATAAQKKDDKKDDKGKLQVSAEFRKPAAELETALKAGDYATAKAKLGEAAAVAKNESEQYYIAAMRYVIGEHDKDNAAMQQALDVLLVNPQTPPETLPAYNFRRGLIALDEKKSADAIPYLLKARELGSKEADLPLLLARAYIDTGKTAEGVAEIDKAIKAAEAAGGKAPDAWYAYAVAKLYTSGDRTATADWLMREVHAYPTAKNWRKVIIVYRDSVNAKGEALTKSQKLDLFRLMRATKTLADKADYFDYADIAQQSGLPWETIAVIKEGRASGVVPASDADFNRVYAAAQAGVQREQSLASYEKLAAADKTGKMAAQTGDAYLASGDFAKAAELYKMALTKGGVDASAVNLHLGVALAQSGDKAGAKDALGKVQGQPLADIANFWSVSLDVPVQAA